MSVRADFIWVSGPAIHAGAYVQNLATPKIPDRNAKPRGRRTWPLTVIFSPRVAAETAVRSRPSPKALGADSKNILFLNRRRRAGAHSPLA